MIIMFIDKELYSLSGTLTTLTLYSMPCSFVMCQLLLLQSDVYFCTYLVQTSVYISVYTHCKCVILYITSVKMGSKDNFETILLCLYESICCHPSLELS